MLREKGEAGRGESERGSAEPKADPSGLEASEGRNRSGSLSSVREMGGRGVHGHSGLLKAIIPRHGSQSLLSGSILSKTIPLNLPASPEARH